MLAIQLHGFFITLGAFGIVCKGVYTKETDTDTEVLDVAIKTLRGKHSPHLQCNFITVIHVEVQASKTEQFIKECIIAKKFNHPNILNLIGVSFLKEGGMPMMILPFMHNGDVKSFVQSKRGNILEVTEYPEVRSCSHCNVLIATEYSYTCVCVCVCIYICIF